MTASGLKLLVINTDLPIFPGSGGVEFLSMTRLAARLQAVGLVSLTHTRDDLERSQNLVSAGVRLYLENPWFAAGPPTVGARPDWIRRVHRWLHDVVETWRAGGRPADTRMMDARFANMAPALTKALSERSWHTVAVVQSSAAAMIDRVPRHLVSVLVMHDIRARLYERRAAISPSLIERRRLQWQARRYAKFESNYCRRFDLVVAVSPEDARWVESHYRPRRVYELALPVDTSYFTPALPSDEQPGRIVFTGLLSHPPNVDAAVYFAKAVLPIICRSEPSVEFHIIGRHPLPEVVALTALPNVQLFANVPDIRTHLRPACVVVVPLRYGSGARQKILEAWSMEKCVVSTTIGAEGLAYEDGSNLFIANSAETMAATVVSALRDPALRGRVRHSGRVVVQSRHNPECLAAGYHAELTEVARQKAEADTRMRVLIDMRWMLPGVAGGIETLARAFMHELLALDATNQYCALVPARCRYDFDIRGRDNVRMVCQDSAWESARGLGRRAERRLLAWLRLPNVNTPEVRELSRLAELGVEIGYSFPGYIHPQLWPLRNVVVIPDIQHEYFPEFFAPEALEERRRVYTDAARRADHICAISEFTRQTLIDRLGVDPDRVTTVPLAADASFRPDDVEGTDRSVLEAHGLSRGGYLYFPAHTWRHKNHVTAIEALGLLRDRHNIRLTLVCSGGAREAQRALEAKIDGAGLREQVRFLGYLPRSSVPALYRGAACLVFPSLFEGFGMPVLEAMSSGCPVVCSNTTSLPEIVGSAADMIDPSDADALAEAVARLVADQELRSHRSAAGLARSRAFSWRRHTMETISVLRKVHQDLRRF